MKIFIKKLFFPTVFFFGKRRFKKTKVTSFWPYAAFRFLFVASNGRVNDRESEKLAKQFPLQKVGGTSQFHSKYSEIDIISAVEQKGYFEMDCELNDTQIELLIQFANESPCKCLDVSKKGVHYLPEEIPFLKHETVSPRYQFSTSSVANNPTVQELFMDPFINSIAAGYLKCQPILDVITMWWSVPFNQKATDQAAQMYHFDMDRFKFIKFFFYLTDVHTDNGPHCYIEGSHKSLPNELLSDRRFSDEELKKFYPESAFKEFVGKKGTMLIVDTRGLHKGKPLVKDNRLLLQIQFSNSLFGAPFEPIIIKNPSDSLQTYLRANPRMSDIITCQ